MRYFSLLFFSLFLFASESKVCQKCHPIIYKEYQQSSHKNASLVNNVIHKAMWKKERKYKDDYSCAKCHSPSDKQFIKTAILDENSFTQREEPISCVYCHTISDIKEHSQSNETILNDNKREFYSIDKEHKGSRNIKFSTQSSFFGLIKSNSGSPYHKLDYSNENYYSGNMCMGCHSHNRDEHGNDTFILDALVDSNDKESCISCHMPQIKGSKVTIKESKTHAYHAIAGIKQRVSDMGKYIEISLERREDSFTLHVKNRANHALFGQKYRQGLLHVELYKADNNSLKLEPFIFEKNLSKDTLLYEKKDIKYKVSLSDVTKIKIMLLVRNISQEGVEALNLEKNIIHTNILKSKTIRLN